MPAKMLRLSLLSAACQYGRSFQLWKLGGGQSPDASLNEALAREPEEVAMDLDRRFEERVVLTGRVIRFPRLPLTSEAGRGGRREGPRHAVRAALRGGRGPRARGSGDAPLALSGPSSEARVHRRLCVRDEAEFLYRFIETPRRPIGLFDEREYFLGETALLAGTACRQLSRREEATSGSTAPRPASATRSTRPPTSRASDTSGSRSGSRSGSSTSCSRCLPALLESFRQLEMHDEALKCRFLEGLALLESDELTEAVRVFDEIVVEAERLGNSQAARERLREPDAHLRDDGERRGGHRGLRESHPGPAASRRPRRPRQDPVGAGDAPARDRPGRGFDRARTARRRRSSRRSACARTWRRSISSSRICCSRPGRSARRSARSPPRCPIISELKMAPEGMAALQLLRESARRQEINRQALRELHGYFEELHT